MPEGRLSPLYQCLADVADAECSLMRAGDVVVDDARQVQRDVVLGHADLLGHLDDLNLDIDLDELLGEGVDLDETGVDGAVEATEFGDEADVAL